MRADDEGILATENLQKHVDERMQEAIELTHLTILLTTAGGYFPHLLNSLSIKVDI